MIEKKTMKENGWEIIIKIWTIILMINKFRLNLSIFFGSIDLKK